MDHQHNTLNLIETGPLIVSFAICLIYVGHSLIRHGELPDLNRLLPLALSCVGIYGGILIAAAVVVPYIREIIIGQYLSYAFFISSIVITLTSLRGMHDAMVCLHRHDDSKLRARHVALIITVFTMFVFLIGYIARDSANKKLIDNLSQIETTSSNETAPPL